MSNGLSAPHRLRVFDEHDPNSSHSLRARNSRSATSRSSRETGTTGGTEPFGVCRSDTPTHAHTTSTAATNDGGGLPCFMVEPRHSASPVAELCTLERVADSHPKDDPLLGDTLTPAHGPRTDPAFEATHHSGEHLDPVAQQPASLAKGEPLDRYVVLDRLGQGGMGEVYAAWDPVLDRKIAIKLLKAEHQASGIADELRLRLMREAQALARMTHPNVVTVHDVGVVEGQVYLAMEFVEGLTLTKWLAEKPRGWREILGIFLDAGEGLSAAHDAGVTHRDFKPDNVVISRDGRARVMDFGLAHAHENQPQPTAPLTDTPTGSMRRRITLPGIMLGTPAYMSPEAMYGQKTDPRSDEFSFAIALFEALYGFRPFEGTTAPGVAAEIQLNRIRPPPRKTSVPRRIYQLLQKALRANPDERFQTLRALLVQLGRRRSSRQRQLATVAVAVLSAFSLVLVVVLSRREAQRCAGVSSRLIGVWDEKTKREARAAFERSTRPWAMAAWSESERLMDGWGRRWVDRRRAACEASDGRADEQLGQSIVCLSRRLADFDATAQLFKNADDEIVERAVSLAAALPTLSACEHAAPVRSTEEGDELRKGLAGVRALIDAGKLRDARERVSQVMAQATSQDASDALAEATWLKARLAAAELDFAKADQLSEDAILLAQQHQSDEVAARAWVDRVGFAGASNLDLQDAERWARYARVAVNRFGAPRELEASLANNEAVLRSRQGRHDEALAGHQKALGLREAVFGPESPLAARSHNNCGITLRAMGRRSEAIAEFKRALSIEEKVLAPDHPAVADTLNNLANALHDDGAHDAAISALERSLSIRERAYGADSPKVAQSLSNLGAVWLDTDKPKEALAVLTRALAIKEKTAGPSALTVAVTLTNLATAQRRANAFAEAIESDSRALEIRKTALGAASPELARNLAGLGATKLGEGNTGAARGYLEQALALASPKSIEHGDAAFLLAKALGTSQRARSLALIEDALLEWPASYGTRTEAKALHEALQKR
ncbi:MAG: serine/threonine-protein kinase [Myxococcales bacterium]|nr:serine/threonine-protein kinase [Myxococcales bacterium]